jgi:hypothetical protein
LEAFLPGKLGAVEASINENSTVENRGRRETCPAFESDFDRGLSAREPRDRNKDGSRQITAAIYRA